MAYRYKHGWIPLMHASKSERGTFYKGERSVNSSNAGSGPEYHGQAELAKARARIARRARAEKRAKAALKARR